MWPNLIEIFFDKTRITLMTWDKHIKTIRGVCCRLENNGCTVNLTMWAWDATEAEFLGFRFTPNGYKPCASKVNST